MKKEQKNNSGKLDVFVESGLINQDVHFCSASYSI